MFVRGSCSRSNHQRIAATAAVSSLFASTRQCASASTATTSLAAGFFKVKIQHTEMFPYPTRVFSADEGDNLETIVRSVQEKKTATTAKDVLDWSVQGSPIASEYGGLQLSETAHSVALEELARNAPASTYLSLIQHVGTCAYLIKSFGSSGTKAKYLGGMSDASIRMGWAVQESHAMVDVSMNTTVASSNGDGSFTINGKKLVSFASDATHFLVLARAPTQATSVDGTVSMVEKATFFIVERPVEGAATKGAVKLVPTLGNPNLFEVSFDNVVASEIVGAVGEGYSQYVVSLHSCHHLVSATVLGVLKRILAIATVQAKAAAGSENQAKLSAAAASLPTIVSAAVVEIFGLESALFALTANLDLPTADSLIEATLCASLISRQAPMIAKRLANAVQYAQPAENADMTEAVADLRRVLTLPESCDYLLSVAACCGIEDFGLYFQKASTLETMQNRTLRAIGFRDSLPSSATGTWPEAKKIEDAVLKFGAAVEHIFIRQNVRLRHSTLTMTRIGEAAALLYAATAAVSRVGLVEKKGVVGASKKIATQFIASAIARVEVLCNECRHSGMTGDESYKRIALEAAEDVFRQVGGEEAVAAAAARAAARAAEVAAKAAAALAEEESKKKAAAAAAAATAAEKKEEPTPAAPTTPAESASAKN